MTATATRTVATTTSTGGPTLSLWRTGIAAGMTASAATVAVAAAAIGLDVSLETAPGESIPLLGFAQLTMMCTLVGILIARAIGRRAQRPRAMLMKVTVGLTALSMVPDLMLSAGAATKATLVLTHLVAAAIVIPALCARLPETATR